MIQYPNEQQLIDLIQKESGTCVSILMPTHRSGSETQQDPIRFKNLVEQAIERVNDSDVIKRLNRIRETANSGDFWQHRLDGLAIFVSDGFDEIVSTDHTLEEYVYVGEDFFVRPLAYAGSSTATRVLAISWEKARLFSCNGHAATEVSGGPFPAAMDELVTPRDPEAQLQNTSHLRAGQSGAGGDRGGVDVAMFHGQGDGEDKIEADRRAYLTRVGDRIGQIQYNTSMPLIVMATEEVAGHFAAVYDGQIASVIHASPDGLTAADLNQKMVEAAKEVSKQSSEALIERFGTALSEKQAADKIEVIAVAAANGRVETLMIEDAPPVWGRFDCDKQEVIVDDNRDESNCDLLNFAVKKTLLAGGRVTATDHKKGPIAAIFRYGI